MSAREILEKKEVLCAKDIAIIFEINIQTAYKKIREIRSVSDRLGFSGKVHRKDYEDYINRLDKKVVM